MSNTYKFGNGTWATKKGSTLAYSDTNNAFKPLPFNFTRDSIATRVNKEGLIEVVGNDIPRIDYTDSAKGALLLEPARTNSFTYSEDFSDGSWQKSQATVTITNEISPNGNTNNVYNYVGNNSNVYTTSQAANIEYTISCYVKSNGQGKDTFTLRLGNERSVVFTATSEWKKYSFTNTPTTNVFSISSNALLDANVLIWGAQLEVGSYATSYIPTNGSTVQRADETCNGSGNSEVFNDSQGVLFANIAANSYGGGYKLISLTDSTSGNSFVSIGMMSNTNQSYKQIRFGGINLFTNFNDPIDQTSFNKIAIKYKSGDSSFYVNGFEIDSSSVTYTPSANMSEFKFSYFQDGDDFYGKTKEIGYYDTALTDLELETLTSYRSLNEMVTELNLNAL